MLGSGYDHITWSCENWHMGRWLGFSCCRKLCCLLFLMLSVQPCVNADWGCFSPHVEYITSGYILMCLLAPFGFHVLNASCNNSVEFPDSCCRSVYKEALSLRTLRHETKGKRCFPLLITAFTGLVLNHWSVTDSSCSINIALIKHILCVYMCAFMFCMHALVSAFMC